MTGAELHTLTGAYAVHALFGREREAFLRHLVVCEACAQEVRELEATAARLGSAAAVTPPPRMKEQVLARIADVRQLPPEVEEPTDLSGPGWPGGVGGPGGPGGPGDGARAHRGGSRWARRLPKFALAACLAAASVAGVLAHQWREDAQREQARAHRAEQRARDLAGVLGAPDAVSATGRIKGGGNGVVVYSRSRGEAAFLAGGLPQLPASKTYQLWFDDNGTMRSAGLLRPDQAHDAATLLAPDVRQASGVGLTVEPAGGSREPSTAPVLLLNFPSSA
ncbi:anti-sigma factor [Wenjunlia tyrosinilytica]|uniref:Regulator of SigK n=1 Tax=Wenjunlia tyrosinilytica TaxID=1544741 RepID=A0A918DRB0_9ACTN|nr:anti-sigma factor [Wenjunlia tyrosinilytica]GGO79858.1 hypothetical protein GCM10012280_00360 [Wenjunlia tyrosinilytica]